MCVRNGLLLYLIILTVSLHGICFAQNSPSVEDRAYEYNRAGMMDMSMARFEEAIEEFRKAAALLPDYQIRGRSLVYTPIFMTAWAYEKIGRQNEACDQYRKFLESSPPEVVEESKAQHAREVLDQCRH